MDKRYSFLFFLLIGSAAFAQERVVHYIQAEAPLEVIDQRNMTEAVLDVDPNAEILFHFDDQSVVQINANPVVSITEIRQSIQTKGITLLADAPVIELQQPVYATPDGRPMYVATGNEAADRAAY